MRWGTYEVDSDNRANRYEIHPVDKSFSVESCSAVTLPMNQSLADLPFPDIDGMEDH